MNSYSKTLSSITNWERIFADSQNHLQVSLLLEFLGVFHVIFLLQREIDVRLQQFHFPFNQSFQMAA